MQYLLLGLSSFSDDACEIHQYCYAQHESILSHCGVISSREHTWCDFITRTHSHALIHCTTDMNSGCLHLGMIKSIGTIYSRTFLE